MFQPLRFILVAAQQARGIAALLTDRPDEAFDHLIRMPLPLPMAA